MQMFSGLVFKYTNLGTPYINFYICIALQEKTSITMNVSGR